MSVREILTLPDPRLKTAVDPVDAIDETLRTTATNLSDTVDDSPGVALAAPQIGDLAPVICVDVSQDTNRDVPNHGKTLLINPSISEQRDPEIIREGCLSVPDYTGDVSRYQRITVEGLSPEGTPVRLEAKGWEAVAFQHEVDHLNGVLFLDRIEGIRENLHERGD